MGNRHISDEEYTDAHGRVRTRRVWRSDEYDTSNVIARTRDRRCFHCWRGDDHSEQAHRKSVAEYKEAEVARERAKEQRRVALERKYPSAEVLSGMSDDELSERAKNARAVRMYFEAAEGPQYGIETAERSMAFAYLDRLSAEIRKRGIE